METQIAQNGQKQNGVSIVSQDVKAIEGFQGKLATPPVEAEIKINSMAGNSKYLPISFVENKLDELFFGLWQVKNFRWQVIANEIVGSLELGLYHPVLKEWIWREGAAATLIQQKSEKNGGTGDITNIGDKIKNTLVKDFPHLKAECLKNAARSIGKAFGRDLNREFEDSYTPLSDTLDMEPFRLALEKAKSIEEIQDLLDKNPQLQQNVAVAEIIINKASTSADLTTLYRAFPYLGKSPAIVAKFSTKKMELTKQEKGGVYGKSK